MTMTATAVVVKPKLNAGDKILIVVGERPPEIHPATVESADDVGLYYSRPGHRDHRYLKDEGKTWCRGQTGAAARALRAYHAKAIRDEKAREAKRKLEEAKRKRARDREAEDRFVEILQTAHRAVARAKLPREFRVAAFASLVQPSPHSFMFAPFMYSR